MANGNSSEWEDVTPAKNIKTSSEWEDITPADIRAEWEDVTTPKKPKTIDLSKMAGPGNLGSGVIPKEEPKLSWTPPGRTAEPQLRAPIPGLEDPELEITPKRASAIAKRAEEISRKTFEAKYPGAYRARSNEQAAMFISSLMVAETMVPKALATISAAVPAFRAWTQANRITAGLISKGISGGLAGVSVKNPETPAEQAAIEGAVINTAYNVALGIVPRVVREALTAAVNRFRPEPPAPRIKVGPLELPGRSPTPPTEPPITAPPAAAPVPPVVRPGLPAMPRTAPVIPITPAPSAIVPVRLPQTPPTIAPVGVGQAITPPPIPVPPEPVKTSIMPQDEAITFNPSEFEVIKPEVRSIIEQPLPDTNEGLLKQIDQIEALGIPENEYPQALDDRITSLRQVHERLNPEDTESTKMSAVGMADTILSYGKIDYNDFLRLGHLPEEVSKLPKVFDGRKTRTGGVPLDEMMDYLQETQYKGITEGQLLDMMTKYGETIKNSPKAGGMAFKPESSPLSSEALKHDTVEGFINSKPTLYHGTLGKFETFKPYDKVPDEFKDSSGQHTFGTYFADNKELAGQFGKNILERKLNINNPFDVSKVKSFDELTQKLGLNTKDNSWELKNMKSTSYFDEIGGKGESAYRALEALEKKFGIIAKLKKQGHDALLFADKENGIAGLTTVVFDTNKILDKSSLTSIWNKAHGKGAPEKITDAPINVFRMDESVKVTNTRGEEINLPKGEEYRAIPLEGGKIRLLDGKQVTVYEGELKKLAGKMLLPGDMPKAGGLPFGDWRGKDMGWSKTESRNWLKKNAARNRAERKTELLGKIKDIVKERNLNQNDINKMKTRYEISGTLSSADVFTLEKLHKDISLEQARPDITPKEAIKENIMPEQKDVTMSEGEALRKQMKDFERGIKSGRKEQRDYFWGKIKESGDAQAELVKHIQETLPKSEQAVFIKSVADAKTEMKQARVYVKVDIAKEKSDRRAAVAELKKQAGKYGNTDVEYQKQIGAILDDIDLANPTFKTIIRLRGLRDFIAKNGQPMGLSQARIDAIDRLTKKPVSAMTTDEIKDLTENIKQLKKIGDLKRELKYKYNKAERDKKIDSVVASSENIDPPLTGNDTTDSIIHEAKQMYMNTLHAPRVAQMMDGYKDGENYGMVKRVWGAVMKAKERTESEVTSLFEELRNIKEKWTEKETQDIVILLHQEQGALEQVKTLLDKYGYDTVPEMKPEYRKAIDAIRKKIDKYDEIAAIYEEKENEILDRVDNYFPMKYEREFNPTPKDLINRVPFRKTSVRKGFTERRVEGVKKIPRTDLLNIVEESLNEQNWYIHVQPELENTSQIVFSDKYTEKAGELASNWWADYLDVVARRGWGAKATASPTLRAVRLNLNNAVLGYKLSTIAMQPFAIFDALSYVETKYGREMSQQVLKEFTKTWLNPKYAQRIKDSSVALNQRMGGEIALEEVYAQAKGKKIMGAIRKAAMAPIRWADITTAAGVQQGIENALIKAGVPDARKGAEFMMNLAQGSSDVSMRPLILSKGELARSWFTFQTFMLNRWGIVMHDTIMTGLKHGDLNGKWRATLGLGIVLAGAVAEEYTRRNLYEATTGKELKNPKTPMQTAVMFLPSQVPYFGNVFESAMSGRKYDIPVTRVMNEVFTGMAQIKKGNVAKGSVRLAENMSLMLGIPGTAQLFDVAERLKGDDNKSGIPQDIRKRLAEVNKAQKAAAQPKKLPWLERVGLVK